MELIKCFKALSDKTRLRLLYILQFYELNVNEIVLVVNMIQSGVSRHLKILQESGLLNSRRDGSFIYYGASKNSVSDALIPLLKTEFASGMEAKQDIKKAEEMIRIRQNRTKRFFKHIAPKWDRLKKEVLGDFNLNEMLQSQIPMNKKVDKRIADLGCGTGELLNLISFISSNQLIGIDSSPEMLEQAKIRLSGSENIQLRLGELEHLPMKNEEIDVAIMNLVLHHVPQPQLPIKEVFRVLKSKGIFIFSDFEKHNQEHIKEIIGGEWLGFENKKIKSWLVETGFAVQKVESYDVNLGLQINIFIGRKQ
jgi:ubiquinone/menaquinone biosynthesis C-methylase UbiE